MYGYIYETTNIVNGRKYIGQHKSEKFDTWYKGSGKILELAFEKYGKENFETRLIQWCSSREELNEKEKYYIKLLMESGNDYYNLAPGGEGGDMSKFLIGRKSPMQGKSFTEEHKRKLSESNKGKHFIGGPMNKGKRMINKDGNIKYIHESEIDEYIQNGWSLGSNRTKDSMGRFI